MNSGTSQNIEAKPIKVKRTATAPATATPTVTAHPADSRFQNQAIVRQLELAGSESSTLPELLAQLTRIIAEQSECVALWISQADTKAEGQPNAPRQFSKFHPLTDESADAVWESVATTAVPLVEHIGLTEQIGSAPLPFSTASHLVATPLRSQSKPEFPFDFVLLGCFQTGDQTVLRLQWLFGLASLTVSNWFQSRTIGLTETKQRGLNEAIRMVNDLNQTTSQTQAAIVIVNQLRQILGAEQVALTLKRSLVAISDVEQVDTQNESNRIIQAACNQSLESGQPIAFPGADEEITSEQLALESYCRSNRIESCLGIPLTGPGSDLCGGLLIAGQAELLNNPKIIEQVQQLVALIGPHLDIVMRANRSVKEIATEKVQSLRKHRWRKPIGIAILGILLMLAIPLPYRVACNCEVQPVLRRFVAAPYDGILERTLVENGTVVTKNQLLARLDGRNLRIELAGLEAEFAGAKKRCDSALATGDIAQSQIARSETERLTAKIDLLQQRTANLEVRSPIDGIIVSGDLDKVEGAPLEMGQTLFEVAPLDQMVGEIAIPESEIKYAQDQMKVAIKLNAFPFQTFSGTIKSIHPRSEVIDNESVFIAQVLLPNDGDILRPGMKGSAKIKSSWAPLGWNLFHRPWEAIRYWTIW